MHPTHLHVPTCPFFVVIIIFSFLLIVFLAGREKHEGEHRPKLHGGPVLKFNANQRYATNAVTAAILRRVAALVDVPLQDFVVSKLFFLPLKINNQRAVEKLLWRAAEAFLSFLRVVEKVLWRAAEAFLLVFQRAVEKVSWRAAEAFLPAHKDSGLQVRNDSPCGSTIGPILSAGLAVRTVGLFPSKL
jgi:hypothetical protein